MFFFFKQKTAYEMRISDWSSDVCSSDLGGRRHAASQQLPDDIIEAHWIAPLACRLEARHGAGCGCIGRPRRRITEGPVCSSRPAATARDRKSTRLNSSH